jgi:putative transposase
MSIKLHENALVCYKNENWRIIHLEDLQRVLASRVSDQRLEFLPIPELKCPLILDSNQEAEADNVAANRPKIRSIRIDQQDKQRTSEQEKQWEAVTAEYAAIKKILRASKTERAPLITNLSQNFGISQRQAYRRINIIKENDRPEALLQAPRSDRNTRKISDEVKAIILEHLAKYRFRGEPEPLEKILLRINGECKKRSLKGISLSTLWSFEQETPLKQKLEKQGRLSKAKGQFGSKVGELPDKDYPLAVVQIDHTPVQVCLVDEVDRQPLRDPWLTLVIDCYSRMILAFYLTFEAPSTLSAGIALARAFLPKEDHLKNLGLSGDWPCWGFPDVIVVDNAAELNGYMMHEARSRYRFDLRDRPVGSPNFGGHVESAFRTFMHELKSIPGTKFSNPQERAEYDSEGRAILTLREFEVYFTDFIINDYHIKEHSGKGMDRLTPLLKWGKGILEGDIMPPTGLQERPSDPTAIYISMLPIEYRTIRGGIVCIFNEDYTNPALPLISDTINLGKPIKERLYEIRYDPRDISKLWIFNPVTKDYLPLHFTDIRKGSISLWEKRAQRKRIGKPAEQFHEQRYASIERRDALVHSATKRTKQVRLEAEKARHRQETSLVSQTTPKATPPVQKVKAPLNPDAIKAMREKVRPAPASSVIKDIEK